MTKKYRYRIKEKKLIGTRVRFNIDIMIFICFLLILFNLHPYTNITKNQNEINNSELVYVFYDYDGNSYILNQSSHGAASSWEYLFDDSVPNEIKNNGIENSERENDELNDENFIDNTEDRTNIVDLKNNNAESTDLSDSEYTLSIDLNNKNIDNLEQSNVKNNQISIEEIMHDLGVSQDMIDNSGNEFNNSHTTIVNNTGNSVEIDLSNIENNSNNELSGSYDIHKEGNMLIVKYNEGGMADGGSEELNDKFTDKETDNQLSIGFTFPFLDKGLLLPTLISREDIGISPVEYDENSNHYFGNSSYTFVNGIKDNSTNEILDYKNCKTPRGYDILHGESVLAYQQLDNAPNICNIERRFCWNGKLSGTFTQQGCSVNEDYSYSQRGEANISHKQDKSKQSTIQNSDGSVIVNDKEVGSSFVFDKPNNKSTSRYESENNIKLDDEVEQTERVYRDCTTPRGESVSHGQLVQAFKHANGFSDSPCEMQFRLCSMGELMGSYTESSCKNWNTSFIDWINDSPTWETYSKEKLQRVKKVIKSEQVYDKDYGVLTNSDALDKILQIMEE